ncbi:endonuclease III [Halocella sp. SP3-1]|uniref:endonuclease III n=1 Tax=Halocella sp. SP3-1 TaxID=2382161 RepID=UPI000F74EE25|nr:endonuclease III [Halocella sp. SP3-1]AZO95385.1 endonuclease III [Halocella sp. SP3-1]MTI61144.1 endonuclease III [Bacillota bacterium]
MNVRKVTKIIMLMEEKWPKPVTELNYSSPFELLLATILSAQSTDKQVNKVTKRLFKKYNQPGDFAEMKKDELAQEINSIGLYRNKSKFIIESSQLILKEFKGKVPDTRKELMRLPGVGRKTANVILASAFQKNAIAVDTHVFRVANRLGLVKTDKVVEVEKQLMNIIPEEKWSDLHHWLIFLGRRICKARNPHCNKCFLQDYCEYYNSSK